MANVDIHPTAVIDPGAIIGDETKIGPYCVISDGVKIGVLTGSLLSTLCGYFLLLYASKK